MLYPVWSAKAGAGCTTVTLALGAVLARESSCLLIDLGGDLPAAAALADPFVGVSDWLASESGDAEAFGRLEQPLGLGDATVVGLGDSMVWPRDRDSALLQLLANERRAVVVDVGCRYGSRSDSLTRLRNRFADVGASVLVTRAGYLELLRATQLPTVPSSIVLVRENGRSLGRLDVTRLLGAPVATEIEYDPAVARALDAGTMLRRTPRLLNKRVRSLVAS